MTSRYRYCSPSRRLIEILCLVIPNPFVPAWKGLRPNDVGYPATRASLCLDGLHCQRNNAE